MNNFEQENILCSIYSHKEVKNSQVLLNFIANLFLRAIPGRITNDFKLVLTDKNLHIEAIGYSTWGGLQETLYTESIPVKDIDSFNVESIEAELVIKIKPVNKTEMNFICNGETQRDLAFAMARLIPDLKNCN
jgi:hypothetical protein